MIAMLVTVAAIEAMVIAFLLYSIQRIFDAAKEEEPLDPIQWEDWR